MRGGAWHGNHPSGSRAVTRPDRAAPLMHNRLDQRDRQQVVGGLDQPYRRLAGGRAGHRRGTAARAVENDLAIGAIDREPGLMEHRLLRIFTVRNRNPSRRARCANPVRYRTAQNFTLMTPPCVRNALRAAGLRDPEDVIASAAA
jgi:hypothetical protein